MAAVGESRIRYDARGLVEIDGSAPHVAEVDEHGARPSTRAS